MDEIYSQKRNKGAMLELTDGRNYMTEKIGH